MLRFIILVAFVASTCAHDCDSDFQEDYEKIIDDALEIAKGSLETEYELPDLRSTGRHREFIATNGKLTDLTTISREGTVNVRCWWIGAFLKASITLDTLQLDYSNYTFQLRDYSAKGSLRIKINNPKVYLMLKLKKSHGECNVDLTALHSYTTHDVEVTMTGAETSKLPYIGLRWVEGHIYKNVRNVLQKELKKSILAAIGDVDFCRAIDFEK